MYLLFHAPKIDHEVFSFSRSPSESHATTIVRGTLSIHNYGSIRVNDSFEVTASSPKGRKGKKTIRLLGNVHSGVMEHLASEGFVGRCSFFLEGDSGDGTMQFDWYLPQDLFQNFLNDVRSTPQIIQIRTTFDPRARCVIDNSLSSLSIRADADSATDIMLDSFSISSNFSQLDLGKQSTLPPGALKFITRIWKAAIR